MGGGNKKKSVLACLFLVVTFTCTAKSKVRAQQGHFIGLLSLFRYTSMGGKSIC